LGIKRLSLNLQSQQQPNIHQRTPQKEMPNIILFTECGYTQHDKTGSSILWLTLKAKTLHYTKETIVQKV
jgi:hypothetical protein